MQAAGVCFGGMARLATAIKAVRSTGKPTLVLDAGDESVGTLWDVLYPDRAPTAAAQNALGINAFVSVAVARAQCSTGMQHV